MGKLSKLLAKAEELANKELEKLAQQQQPQGGQHQQPCAPPVVIQPQYAGFSTPPPSPPPYAGSVCAGRPSTPPAQHSQSYAQQQQQSPGPATPQLSRPGPQPVLTPGPSAGSRGRKKALLIACSYPGTRAQLRGPSNDIQCMQVCAHTV